MDKAGHFCKLEQRAPACVPPQKNQSATHTTAKRSMKELSITLTLLAAAAFLLSSCDTFGGSSNTMNKTGNPSHNAGFIGGSAGPLPTGKPTPAPKPVAPAPAEQ